MSPDMKLIILANMNVNLFSWTFPFRKVEGQQIWGNMLILVQASSTDFFLKLIVKIMNISSFC